VVVYAHQVRNQVVPVRDHRKIRRHRAGVDVGEAARLLVAHRPEAHVEPGRDLDRVRPRLLPEADALGDQAAEYQMDLNLQRLAACSRARSAASLNSTDTGLPWRWIVVFMGS